MHLFALGLVSATALMALGSSAEALPLVATYTGVLFGTQDAFTAAFHYDTKDLAPSPGNTAFLDAKSNTVQWATYADPFRSLTFTLSSSFAKGEYDSVVYDENGAMVEVDTVHEYTIQANTGLMSLTFGGVNDMGLVTFGPDGTDYAELDPQSFRLTRDVVSPVPLPAAAPLFCGALLLCAVVGHAHGRKRTASTT